MAYNIGSITFDVMNGQLHKIQKNINGWRRPGEVGTNYETLSQSAPDSALRCEKFNATIADKTAVEALKGSILSISAPFSVEPRCVIKEITAVLKPCRGGGIVAITSTLIVNVIVEVLPEA